MPVPLTSSLQSFVAAIIKLRARADGFISTSNSEQKEQTNREKYAFYCSVSQIHINLEKSTKKHQNVFFDVGYLPRAPPFLQILDPPLGSVYCVSKVHCSLAAHSKARCTYCPCS